MEMMKNIWLIVWDTARYWVFCAISWLPKSEWRDRKLTAMYLKFSRNAAAAEATLERYGRRARS